MLESKLRWPTPRSTHPLRVLARSLWAAPTNLVGHALGLLASGRRGRRVAGPAAAGWLYPLRPGLRLPGLHAITLGNAILYRPGMFNGASGRAVLAHELAHTRQHDLLGPLYLPLHGLAQLTSAAISVLRRGPVRSRVHDYNPLEHTWICLGASACYELAAGQRSEVDDRERFLASLGVPPPETAAPL